MLSNGKGVPFCSHYSISPMVSVIIQMSEVGGQRSDGRSQRSEVGGQRAEGSRLRLMASARQGGRKSEDIRSS